MVINQHNNNDFMAKLGGAVRKLSSMHSWALVVFSLILLSSPIAHADIDGFELVSIESDDVTLNSRLGTTYNASEHLINIEDCYAYEGGTLTFTLGLTAQTGFDYATAYSSPAGTCSSSDTSFVNSGDDCFVNGNPSPLDASSVMFDVSLDWLLGGDCSASFDAISTVYIVTEDTVSTSAQTYSELIEIQVDLLQPEPPDIVDIEAGDARLVITWEDSRNSSDEVTYTIYWDEAPIVEEPGPDVASKSGISALHATIEDSSLINGTTYYVRVAAMDDADNGSYLSEEVSAVPVATTDFWELYQASGGTDPGGFCFIATAAYGTEMTRELTHLRAFRDRFLLTHGLGQLFVRTYYRWGRFAAAWIADKPIMRSITRVLLTPLVAVARFLTSGNPAHRLAGALTLFVMLFLVGQLHRRRRLVLRATEGRR